MGLQPEFIRGLMPPIYHHSRGGTWDCLPRKREPVLSEEWGGGGQCKVRGGKGALGAVGRGGKAPQVKDAEPAGLPERATPTPANWSQGSWEHGGDRFPKGWHSNDCSEPQIGSPQCSQTQKHYLQKN